MVGPVSLTTSSWLKKKSSRSNRGPERWHVDRQRHKHGEHVGIAIIIILIFFVVSKMKNGHISRRPATNFLLKDQMWRHRVIWSTVIWNHIRNTCTIDTVWQSMTKEHEQRINFYLIELLHDYKTQYGRYPTYFAETQMDFSNSNYLIAINVFFFISILLAGIW